MPEQRYDIAMIGAGIVGLATALELLTPPPTLRQVVLEKEQAIGRTRRDTTAASSIPASTTPPARSRREPTLPGKPG